MMKYIKKIKLANLGSPRDLIALSISIISFLISSFTLYQTRLKAPDISFMVAPYIKHVVDNQSLNEAFFIPITITNYGAKPGTLLAFELTVTHLPSSETRAYFGQYFTQPNNQTSIGDFFTPITLYGQSSVARIVCFYPPGQRSGNFFGRTGQYTFEITSQVANVRNHISLAATDGFSIVIDESMLALMQSQTDGEYPYPLTVDWLP